jgi:hypothetical protein
MDRWKKFPPKINAAEKMDVIFSGLRKKVDADLGA